MLERDYQKKLIKKLTNLYPDCIILKNDSNYTQGIPDILILYKNKWVALEVKVGVKSKKRPNQNHYIEIMNNMSYASFIFPENEEEILYEIQSIFTS